MDSLKYKSRVAVLTSFFIPARTCPVCMNGHVTSTQNRLNSDTVMKTSVDVAPYTVQQSTHRPINTVQTTTQNYSPDHHPDIQKKKPTQTYSPDHHPELQSRPPPRAPVQTSIQISSPDPHPDTTVQTSTQIPESRPPSRYSISDPHLERREDALIYTQTSQHQSLHVSLCL